MRYIILLILGFGIVTSVPTKFQRIVGGDETTINNYPSIVALLRSIDLHIYLQECGGSILHQRSILTAAHCLFNDHPIEWRVRVGSTWANSGGVVHRFESYIIHPDYDNRFTDYDIAIIRTATPIVFVNNLVQRGYYAGPNYNLGDDEVVWAAGWGLTSHGGSPSEQLRHVQIWTVNQQICRQRYGTILTDNMLCTGWLDVGGRDQCQQDSGGPLYHNGIIVGVCSFGGVCGDPFRPGVNMRVSRFISWINANA